MRSKKVNLQRRPHEDCNLGLQSAWCMRGKKVNLQPSIQIFIVVLCVYVLAGNDKFSQWGCGAWKGRGSDQGPTRPLTTSSAPNTPPCLWLLTNMGLHTRVHVIGYSRRDHDTKEWYLQRGWSILGFPVPVVSDTINLKCRALCILF